MTDTKGYYNLLGVSRNASKEEISKAYKKLALQYHPDRTQDKKSHEMFKKIVDAYEVLSNDDKRKNYDMYGNTNSDIFIDHEKLFKKHFDMMKKHFGIFDDIFFEKSFKFDLNKLREINNQLSNLGQLNNNYSSFSRVEKTTIIDGKKNTSIEEIIDENGKKSKKIITIDDKGQKNERIENINNFKNTYTIENNPPIKTEKKKRNF